MCVCVCVCVCVSVCAGVDRRTMSNLVYKSLLIEEAMNIVSSYEYGL